MKGIDCPEAIAFYRKKKWVASIEQISIKVYMITTGNPQNGGKELYYANYVSPYIIPSKDFSIFINCII